MNFLDKLTHTASQTYKYTAEKTTKIAKTAKLKAMMNEDKQKIEDLYTLIGKEVYENHIREEKIDIVAKIEEVCKEIDAYANEIQVTRMELLKLRDLKQCKKCSYEMELDYNFCPSCGATQENNMSIQTQEIQKDEKENGMDNSKQVENEE